MQPSSLLGTGALLTTLGLVLVFSPFDRSGDPAAPLTPPPPPQQAVAEGHCVLVVEGDRNGLAITSASRKPDPWAGVQRGLVSDWTLSLLAADGSLLAEIPLDVARFATDAADVGRPASSQGCIVTDAHVAMLVNVPWFAAAEQYVFARREGARTVPLGTVTGARVRELTGGGR